MAAKHILAAIGGVACAGLFASSVVLGVIALKQRHTITSMREYMQRQGEDPELTASGGVLLDKAMLMVEAAQQKAVEIKVPMVISVVDMDGNLVLLHRMENSLLASLEISPNKAFTAVALKMPSADVKKLAQEGEELQGIAVQHAGRIVEFGGGIPIVIDGVQVGGIGVSGGSVAEDTSVAEAGLAALK